MVVFKIDKGHKADIFISFGSCALHHFNFCVAHFSRNAYIKVIRAFAPASISIGESIRVKLVIDGEILVASKGGPVVANG